jgi:predicted O-methyltransferase YrrM
MGAQRWDDELTAPAAEPDNAEELDVLAEKVLLKLCDGGFLSAPVFLPHRFRELDDFVRQTFDVPHTTMTALARRILFGVAATAKPSTTVVLGSFVGYAAVWLFGPALLPEPLFQATSLVACDVFPPAIAQATENFSAFGSTLLDLRVQAAEQLLAEFSQPIDLLYIDVDSAETGKCGYADLLRAALPLLAPGALVLAHDVTHPFYLEDVASYQSLVRDRRQFRRTATLEIDPCGLEVTLV